jgi:hypothetical protein
VPVRRAEGPARLAPNSLSTLLVQNLKHPCRDQVIALRAKVSEIDVDGTLLLIKRSRNIEKPWPGLGMDKSVDLEKKKIHPRKLLKADFSDCLFFAAEFFMTGQDYRLPEESIVEPILLRQRLHDAHVLEVARVQFQFRFLIRNEPQAAVFRARNTKNKGKSIFQYFPQAASLFKEVTDVVEVLVHIDFAGLVEGKYVINAIVKDYQVGFARGALKLEREINYLLGANPTAHTEISDANLPA